MLLKPLSIKDITSQFIHVDDFEKIDGRPNWLAINKIKIMLVANASTVESSLGGGNHGHYFLLENPADYLAITGEAFNAPANPGAEPIVPPTATGAQISAITSAFQGAVYDYRTYRNVDIALRNILLRLVGEQFIDPLRHPLTSFGNVTTLQLLNHLFQTYGVITRKQMKENLTLFNSDWGPPTPIENLFKRFKDCRAFALRGGNEINEVTTVDSGYDIIFRGNMHSRACDEWRLLPIADQTYAAFQTHFIRFEEDRVLVAATEHNNFAANAAIANTAAAQQAAIATAVRLAVQAAVLPLQRALSAATPRTNRQPANPRPPVAPAGGAVMDPAHLAAMGLDPNYCHTHGFTHFGNHTSATCRNPAHGHQVTATATNQMGGSQRVWTDNDRNPNNPYRGNR